MMDISLVGTGGMMPLPNRYLTSLLCRYNGRMLLIDCGEGTQVSMKLLGWGYKNIDCICFTHYHADHISGLPGLLLTMSNSGREEELTLIGPPELARIAAGLLVIAPELAFPIKMVELPVKPHADLRIPLTEFYVSALPLDHGRPCFAYSIETRRGAKFDLERAEGLNLPKKFWGALQRGESVCHEGADYTPEMVLGPPRKGFKVCYCTDTRPVRTLPGFIENADLFVCEGMYGDPEKTATAREHMHMVYADAAAIARDGNARALWLTHYSPAMPNPKEHLYVARNIFRESCAAYDRITRTLIFEDE
ncbi:MAG: ribonuclease Z [Defluviitaleaceae bacterium]|nr:ribonuclease Z [Defluviitaleaceae bacterium]MCL2837287.1 ribonuclease Z [Defluviitaleaceae bacterium]